MRVLSAQGAPAAVQQGEVPVIDLRSMRPSTERASTGPSPTTAWCSACVTPRGCTVSRICCAIRARRSRRRLCSQWARSRPLDPSNPVGRRPRACVHDHHQTHQLGGTEDRGAPRLARTSSHDVHQNRQLVHLLARPASPTGVDGMTRRGGVP